MGITSTPSAGGYIHCGSKVTQWPTSHFPNVRMIDLLISEEQVGKQGKHHAIFFPRKKTTIIKKYGWFTDRKKARLTLNLCFLLEGLVALNWYASSACAGDTRGA